MFVTRKDVILRALDVLNKAQVGAVRVLAPAATRTRRELITQVLDALHISQVGQEPSADDVATVEATIDPVVASLRGQGVYDFTRVDTFPEGAFLPLSDLVAAACLGPFQLPPDEVTALRAAAATASQALAYLSLGRDPGERVLDRDYGVINGIFPGFLAKLHKKEIVYIEDDQRIAEEYFLPLGDMLAWEVNRPFGVTGDALTVLSAGAAQAERDLRYMTRGTDVNEPVHADYF